MFVYNADTILTICKYLRLSDINEFQLVNKSISDILIENKDYVLQEENHVLVQPHGLVVIKKGDKVWYTIMKMNYSRKIID
jgi:hypothetical protein